MAKETLDQQDKKNLDLQLDRELEGTFPASDPLTITRFPYRRRSVKSSTGSNAHDATARRSQDENVRAGTNSHVTQKS
ncbi:MAG TPA: hypothetical protein VJV58_18370 [Bradyrhizobium sp.]|uniref:hypothetical protein n=1 Tax=Bradyrhizobium sp. TaxID=376 RepID=UPI002B49C214|nr:hypothetical protein [Bradyrhizobium sp.]HKO72897.1 hypothetical protein [Bradyrhizobium sp.]